MAAGAAANAPRPALFAWCLFDWANSAFPTVITTFVFAAYFTQAVAEDAVAGTEAWGYAVSASALAVAVLGPVMGAIADNAGRRKPWILVFLALSAAAIAMLWWVRPEPSWVLGALVLVGIANFTFEMGTIFYNAMLPDLVQPAWIGRLSGWGWGLGYAGGLACLGVALVALIQPSPPLFDLDAEAAEPVRATAPLVAIWFVVFSIPLFAFTPDTPSRRLGARQAARQGLATLIATFRRIGEHAVIVRYLVAHMIYADGLNTLFAFGGIYAAGTFGFTFDELILFGIAINVSAGVGAALFAWVDDWIGPKKTVLIALTCLALLGAALLFVEGKALFWMVGLPLGIFVGPAQAASRSLMAHLAPPQLRTEMFGLYALSGKATAFLGPALLGWATAAADSQRVGMATILAFLVGGGLLLLTVPAPRR